MTGKTGQTPMTIAEILTQPESKTLEFKRDLSSLKPILKTLVAFANTAGGLLVIGKDNQGDVVGIQDVEGAEERLANAVADNIRPAMQPEIEITSCQGKTLLLVHVPFWRGPFYLKSEGAERGVYIRLGSTSRPAGPELVAELQRTSSGQSFDHTPCPDRSPRDLDITKAQKLFASAGMVLDDAKLASLGILVPFAGRLVPSLGGVILFGSEAVRGTICPDARVSCARFRGNDKTEFLDVLDIEGTVLDALVEVPRFIRRNTHTAARIEGLYRREIPEYPEVAVREALVNAIAHAAYFQSGMRIMVAAYDDRLEIQNPGPLPFGLTLAELKAGVSKIRNRMIARIMRLLHLMEEWGSGYQRINDTCRAGGYPEPEWQELGAAVRVIFRPHPDVRNMSSSDPVIGLDDSVNEPISDPVNEPINKRQQWFLEQLTAEKYLKARDIAEHFSINKVTAKRDIADLKKLGLIEFIGAPKNGYYRRK
jgi:ATP-dependent DNA helicase RecG